MPVSRVIAGSRFFVSWLPSTALLFAALAPLSASAQAALPTGFLDQLIVGGLDWPCGMAQLPDGRTFVIEQKSAKIRLIVNGALAVIDPVCVVDGVNSAGNEQGLLGIAIDPGWPQRPYVYVHCDETSPANTIRISRYTVAGDLAFIANGALAIDVATRRDLTNSLPDVNSNHNGGTLRFGPDGMLYDSMGEDAMGCVAQDDSTLRGVILRLDVSRLPGTPGGPPSLDVITPPDNPQISSPNLKRRLIWAWGLRNPFRFGIDRNNGTLYIGDVGESQYEEIDRAPVGALNFGWPHFEALAVYDPDCSTSSATTAPIHYYDRTIYSGLAAVIGAGIYRTPPGASRPFPSGYEGDVFFGDYYQGFLRRLKGSGNSWSLAPREIGQPNLTDWGTGLVGASDFCFTADGSIWYCRQHVNYAGGSGQIRRIMTESTTGVGDTRANGISLGLPFPQPAMHSVRLPFTLASAARVELAIFDLDGRRIRSLIRGEWLPAGTAGSALWDGLDEQRRPVPAGLYLARLTVDRTQRSRPVTLLR